MLLQPSYLASKLSLGNTNPHPWDMEKPGLPPLPPSPGSVCEGLCSASHSAARGHFLTLTLVSTHPFPSSLSSKGHCFNNFLAIVPVYPHANTNQCELIFLPLYTQTGIVNTVLTLLVPVTAYLGDLSYHNPPQASLGPRAEGKVLPSVLRPITILPSSLSTLSLACTGHSIHQALPLQDPQTPFLCTQRSASRVPSHLDVVREVSLCPFHKESCSVIILLPWFVFSIEFMRPSLKLSIILLSV